MNAFTPTIGLLLPIEDELRSLTAPQVSENPFTRDDGSDAAAKQLADKLLRQTDVTHLRMREAPILTPPPPFAGPGPSGANLSSSHTPSSAVQGALPGVGDRVKARFQGRSRWYFGTIHAVHEDGAYTVDYDDGDVEERVLAKHVKWLPSAADGSGPAAPAGGGEAAPEEVATSSSADPSHPTPTGLPQGKRGRSERTSDASASVPPPPSSRMRRTSQANKPEPAASATAAAESSRDGSTERLEELLGGLDDGTLTRSIVLSITSEVRSMPDGALLNVPKPRVRALLEALHVVVSQATATTARRRSGQVDEAAESGGEEVQPMDEDEDEADGAGQASKRTFALESALLLLSIVTTPKIPTDLLFEESLEAAVALAKRELSRFLAGDVPSTTPSRAPAASARANGKAAKGRAAAAPTLSSTSTSTSAAATMTLVLERLPGLAISGISDALVHQLVPIGLSAAFGQIGSTAPSKAVGSLPLQMAGMHLLLALFTEYPSHRRSILTDVIDARLQATLVPNREARRNYALPDGSRVQMFSALVMLLLQASASLPTPIEPEAEPPPPGASSTASPAPTTGGTPSKRGKGGSSGKAKAKAAAEAKEAAEAAAKEAAAKEAAEVAAKAKKAAEEHPRQGVVRLTAAVLKTFLTKCLDHSDDSEYKFALEDFHRDLLVLLGRPEWPAAPLAAERLGTFLCARLQQAKEAKPKEKGGADAREQTARVIALEQLGVLLSSLFEHKRKHADAPLVFPEAREIINCDAQPNDEGEVFGCPCGVEKYDPSQSYMLDCDLCHRWFHGECMGVSERNDDEKWYCDHCRLSTSVADQRQRIARLLALPTSGGDDDEDVEGGASDTLCTLCTETETTKQLLLNYLQVSTLTDPAAETATSFLLCDWHASASEGGQHPLLCDLYQEQNRLALAARRRLRGSTADAEGMVRIPLLSRSGILVACRRLMAESGLYSKGDMMLTHLLQVLRDPQPSSRARAIKALREVVRADTATLSYRGVTIGVQLALQDTSIAVREGVLDLLGSYLGIRPEFVARYYGIIAARLSDPGVSVRKRVIKILRDICVTRDSSPEAAGGCGASTSASAEALGGSGLGSPVGRSASEPLSPADRQRMMTPSERAIDGCCRMVMRLGPSEEEEVHKLVLKTFSDLWFAPNPDDASAPLAAAECSARCDMLVGVVARTAAAGASGVQRCEWLGFLLSRMLTPPSGETKSAAALREVATAERVCHQLVGQLMESLIQLGESEDIARAPEHADSKVHVAKMGSTLHALALFCAAKPQLLLPHIGVLTQFLHYESAEKAVQHICEMLPSLLRILEHPPTKLLADLEKYLSALIFRVKEGLLPHAIHAFAMTVRASGNAQLIVRILTQFYAHLQRYDAHVQASSPSGELPKDLPQSSLYRAFTCIGLLSQHYDFDAPGEVASAIADSTDKFNLGRSINAQLYDMLRSLTRAGLPAATILYAYKGLGHILVRKPELLVQCHDLISHALAPEAPARLKRQSLDNLRMLLTADEERQKTLSAPGATGSAKKVALSEMHAASESSAAVTGALQRHLPKVLAALLDPRDATVRHSALALVGALLSNGIAHPAKILPMVLALEVDTGAGGTADAALGELRKQYERHKEMLTAPAIALEGAKQAHKLRTAIAARSAAGAAEGSADKSRAAPARLTAMYTLHAANRKPRLAYLRSLLGELAIERHDALETQSMPAELRQAEWLCHALAEMPYDKEGDVLALIYQANRMLSLAAEATLGGAAKLLADEDEKAPKPPAELVLASPDASEALARACHLCAVVGLTFTLKQHLKRAFGISDIRLQAYDPSEAAKAPERQLARLADVPSLDTSGAWSLPTPKKARKSGAAADAPAKADAAVVPAADDARCVAHYCWLRSMISDDDEGFDYNLLAATPKAPVERPPPKSRKRALTGGAVASKSAKTTPGSSGRGAARGGRGGGRGGRGKKKKKAASSSDEESDDDDDDDDFEED